MCECAIMSVQSKIFMWWYFVRFMHRYLRYLRMSVAGDLTFFTSSVWAEMRKSVSYKVDVAVDVNKVIVALRHSVIVVQDKD